MTGNDTPAFEAVLTSSADEATQKKSYLEAASGSRQDLLDELASSKAKLADEVSKLDQAQAQAKSQRDVLAKSKDQADAAVQEQIQIKSQVQGELATLVAQEQQRQAAEQLAKAKAAADAAARTQAARPAATKVSSVPATIARPGSNPTPGGGGAPSSGAAAAIAAARSVLGAPYVWAAAGPNSFDCSGLVMWAWAHGGRSLPHSSAAMYATTRRISVSDLQPGDLVFYGSPIHHVALYIGGGQIIHAPHAGGNVEIASVNYWSDLAGAGRV
jgi:cell wall-associated NlpC family hydrolase